MTRQARGPLTGRESAGLDGLGWRVAWLEDENAALREEQQRLEAERERLRVENERLRAERERLQELNERLRGEVEALRRVAKRQAAPFSKGDPRPSQAVWAEARRGLRHPRPPPSARTARIQCSPTRPQTAQNGRRVGCSPDHT